MKKNTENKAFVELAKEEYKKGIGRKFAILHTTEDHGQILIRKDQDIENDQTVVAIQFRLNSTNAVEVEYRFDVEDHAIEFFEKFENEEKTIASIEIIRAQLEESTTEEEENGTEKENTQGPQEETQPDNEIL